MTCQAIAPVEAVALLCRGARLVDIRSPDEAARARIPESQNRPLDSLGRFEGERPVIFVCRSGMRTSSNSAALAAACDGDSYMLIGGLDGWRKAGFAIESTEGAPLEIMRQVQIAAGSLVLAGTIMGLAVHPAWFGLPAFVGAGLTFAGVSGWCGMALVLAKMPWNRRGSSAG